MIFLLRAAHSEHPEPHPAEGGLRDGQVRTSETVPLMHCGVLLPVTSASSLQNDRIWKHQTSLPEQPQRDEEHLWDGPTRPVVPRCRPVLPAGAEISRDFVFQTEERGNNLFILHSDCVIIG